MHFDLIQIEIYDTYLHEKLVVMLLIISFFRNS